MRVAANKSSEYVSRERRAAFNAAMWGLAWGFSSALCAIVIRHLPEPTLSVGIIAFCVSTGTGLAAIAAYMRWLKSLDEMQRQIWLESYAIAFGLVWLSFSSLLMLYAAEIIQINSQQLLGLLSIFAGLAMIAGRLLSWFRYR